jgi:hypothetical protein
MRESGGSEGERDLPFVSHPVPIRIGPELEV